MSKIIVIYCIIFFCLLLFFSSNVKSLYKKNEKSVLNTIRSIENYKIKYKKYVRIYKKRKNICNFDNDGCKSNSYTGEITVKLLKRGEKVVNAHYFVYETKNETQVQYPVVLSVAFGYSWDKLRVFIISLRKTKYSGPIILFVDKNYSESNLPIYFKKYNVTPIIIDDKWPFYSNLNNDYPIEKEMLYKCMIPDRNYSPYKWNIYRMSLVACFLEKYKNKFSHILHIDCRDILFQFNPFAWNIQTSLYLVEQTDADYCIGADLYDYRWISPYKNATHVFNCRIINCGTVLGDSENFYKFIKRYSDYISHEYILTAEQGTLNYMFYTQKWNEIPILMNRNGYGFALTLAVDLLYRPDVSFFPHSDMFVYNKDGSIPCFVHQYDRKYDKYIDWEKYKTKE